MPRQRAGHNDASRHAAPVLPRQRTPRQPADSRRPSANNSAPDADQSRGSENSPRKAAPPPEAPCIAPPTPPGSIAPAPTAPKERTGTRGPVRRQKARCAHLRSDRAPNQLAPRPIVLRPRQSTHMKDVWLQDASGGALAALRTGYSFRSSTKNNGIRPRRDIHSSLPQPKAFRV